MAVASIFHFLWCSVCFIPVYFMSKVSNCMQKKVLFSFPFFFGDGWLTMLRICKFVLQLMNWIMFSFDFPVSSKYDLRSFHLHTALHSYPSEYIEMLSKRCNRNQLNCFCANRTTAARWKRSRNFNALKVRLKTIPWVNSDNFQRKLSSEFIMVMKR